MNTSSAEETESQSKPRKVSIAARIILPVIAGPSGYDWRLLAQCQSSEHAKAASDSFLLFFCGVFRAVVIAGAAYSLGVPRDTAIITGAITSIIMSLMDRIWMINYREQAGDNLVRASRGEATTSRHSRIGSIARVLTSFNLGFVPAVLCALFIFSIDIESVKSKRQSDLDGPLIAEYVSVHEQQVAGIDQAIQSIDANIDNLRMDLQLATDEDRRARVSREDREVSLRRKLVELEAAIEGSTIRIKNYKTLRACELRYSPNCPSQASGVDGTARDWSYFDREIGFETEHLERLTSRRDEYIASLKNLPASAVQTDRITLLRKTIERAIKDRSALTSQRSGLAGSRDEFVQSQLKKSSTRKIADAGTYADIKVLETLAASSWLFSALILSVKFGILFLELAPLTAKSIAGEYAKLAATQRYESFLEQQKQIEIAAYQVDLARKRHEDLLRKEAMDAKFYNDTMSEAFRQAAE